MKSKWAVLLAAIALPGYQYQFPRDHFSHPDYRTEWWYYTGNLRATNGRRFGFELTFFRFGTDLPSTPSDAWRADQIYAAHLALSDIDGQEFYHTERMNRAGPGLAGISSTEQRYWNGNWQIRWLGFAPAEQQLEAVCDRFTLRLDLRALKPPVIHGQNGISVKGPAPGEASHYISFTRLAATGDLEWKGATFALTGIAWMDHEFFTEQLDENLAGWDWFSIQLDTGEEVMLYRLRRKDGAPDPFSSGTYVDRSGQAHFLAATTFSVQPGETWHRYPVAWRISVPSLGLELSEETALKNQELLSRDGITPRYWEGAVTYEGQFRGQPAHGVGYLEMTGYDPEHRW